MINFFLGSAVEFSKKFELHQDRVRKIVNGGDANKAMSPTEISKLKTAMVLARNIFSQFNDANINLSIERLEFKLDKVVSFGEIYAQMVALSQDIFVLYKNTLIYAYPRSSGELIKAWKSEWSCVLDQFQGADVDIFCGIDLWALGHHTASVFHMMRALECGLVWMSTEVGIVADTQTWQNILEQIESKIRDQYKQKNSMEKQERLRFLSAAAKEFFYFKDGWRNYVSHNKGVYDENQAKSVIDHVREFMTILAVERARASS